MSKSLVRISAEDILGFLVGCSDILPYNLNTIILENEEKN
jgi:hypothetical protein